MVSGAYHHFYRLLLHLPQHFRQVGNAGLHAWFGFQRGDFLQPQPCAEIREGGVLNQNGLPFERRGLFFPACDGGLPLLHKDVQAGAVKLGVAGIEFGQSCR